MDTESTVFARLAGYSPVLFLCKVVLLGCIVLAVLTWQKGLETLTWTATEGEVIKRDMEHGGRRSGVPQPKIHVAYKVDGTSHELIVNDSFVLESPVVVFYNPERPEQASYFQGVDWGTMLMYALVGGIAGLAVLAHVALAARPEWMSTDSRFEDLAE